MHTKQHKAALAMMLVLVLGACRMSCLGFTWQASSGGQADHSCCNPTSKEPSKSENSCNSDVFESALANAHVALDPALDCVSLLDVADAGQRLEAWSRTPVHSPPDLLSLYKTLLI